MVATADAPEAWFEVHAWALGKAGRHLDAARAWSELASASQEPELRAEACFFSGFLAWEVDAYNETETLWQACRRYMSGTSWEPKSQWLLALMAYLQGDKDLAATRLGKLGTRQGADANQYRYWKGRLEIERGNKKAGRRLLSSVM